MYLLDTLTEFVSMSYPANLSLCCLMAVKIDDMFAPSLSISITYFTTMLPELQRPRYANATLMLSIRRNI